MGAGISSGVTIANTGTANVQRLLFTNTANGGTATTLNTHATGLNYVPATQVLTSTGNITAPIQRSLVLDFKDFSWDSGKIEGLALINKNRTLIVSKDNDFGITLKPRDGEKAGAQIATFQDVPTEFLILDFPRPIEDLIATP